MEDPKYAVFKKLLETYQVDPDFRKDARGHAPGLFPAGEDKIMLEAILSICKGTTAEFTANPYVASFRERNLLRCRYVEESFGPSGFNDPDMYRYFIRTRNRCRMESEDIKRAGYIYYLPMAFELSKGCSIGCPFCGLNAVKWEKNAEFDKKLWRGIIEAAFDLLGGIAGECPCFYATEPLDNPDYTGFLREVLDVTGRVPQTTTAASDRNPEKIKELMDFLGKERLKNGARLRMSIISKGQFKRIYELFTPLEIVDVELLANNPGSVTALSASGRGISLDGRRKIRYSISCLAGIRVSLASREMIFSEPVLPNDEYPCGVRQSGRTSFSDEADFPVKMKEMFKAYARPRITGDMKLKLNPDIGVYSSDGFIFLAGGGSAYRIKDTAENKSIIEALGNGVFREDVFRASGIAGAFRQQLYEFLDNLFFRGYIVS